MAKANGGPSPDGLTVAVDVEDAAGSGRDRDAVRRTFETGEYPYDEKLTRRGYEDQKAGLQVELLKVQDWVKETGRKIVVLFEGRDGAGKGGTIKRFTEHLNPRGARVVALDKPTESGADRMVLPALYPPLAARRRNRPVRPLLVQPRRRRAGDGVLQRQGISRVHAPGAGAGAHVRAQRHRPVQVLVLGQPGTSRDAVSRRARTTPSSNGNCRRSTASRSTSGRPIPRPRRRCSSIPTPPTRPGRSSSRTTRNAPG